MLSEIFLCLDSLASHANNSPRVMSKIWQYACNCSTFAELQSVSILDTVDGETHMFSATYSCE